MVAPGWRNTFGIISGTRPRTILAERLWSGVRRAAVVPCRLDMR
jgi:hypothetical protein